MKIFKKIIYAAVYVIVFVIVLSSAFLLSAQHLLQKTYKPLRVNWDNTVGTSYKNLCYGTGIYQTYDLYVPAENIKGQDYSLILFIHGGGFTGGDKAEGEVWGKYFASKGYVCASINYTILTEQTASNLKTMYQETRDAVAEITSKTAELGYPVREMAVTGVSAGGCLALMYAYNPPENSIPVRFVFEQVGPVSFEPSGWGNSTPESCAAFASFMTGEQITSEMMLSGEYKSYTDSISPVAYVNRNTVPTIMGYGTHDSAVPPELKYTLINALEQNKIPYEYIEFSHSGHGLLNDPDKTQLYLDTVNQYLSLYFKNK